jgi:hydrogenase expression/formation protein HypD
MQEYRDPEISRRIAERIRRLSRKEIRLMEVCGTHTQSIFRHGIRDLLPGTITLLSGPGCPVCVTSQKEIDAFIATAAVEGVTTATFGDLMRVPGTRSSLQKEKARGRDVRVVYSSSDALELALKSPERKVVFLGVGFETTAPTIAASLILARDRGIRNYSVFSAHKLVPPALKALLDAGDLGVDGLILPGHVSVIIGTRAYESLAERYCIPCAVAGFEPVDILQAILALVEQVEEGRAEIRNCYPRAVTPEGNPRAREVMDRVFERVDATWRGLGVIPASGLRLREEFSGQDAERVFSVSVPEPQEPAGCACGEILTGRRLPPQCPLYKRACTPMAPVGPCMVSSEGTCGADFPEGPGGLL